MHNHLVQWFYTFTTNTRLSATAQQLWHCLYYRMGQNHTTHFCEIASTAIEAELGICRKTLQRARVALVKAGLLRCEVRGKSVYYMLLVPEDSSNIQPESTVSNTVNEAPMNNTTASTKNTALHADMTDTTVTADDSAFCMNTIITMPLSADASDAVSAQYPPAATSRDYAAAMPQRQPDVLFNNKYEILLYEYLDKYRDNRFAQACSNHFAMLKELYRSRGKKTLTAGGFHNIMQQLDILSGDDMETRLAIMERSLRNRWAGFFPLPENSIEYKKAEQHKQGRKQSSYRSSCTRSGKRYPKPKFQPEGRDLNYLMR